MLLLLLIACRPVSECWYEQEIGGKVRRSERWRPHPGVPPHPREPVTRDSSRWAACKRLCGNKSISDPACMEPCQEDGVLFSECEQIGREPDFPGIPY
jgi:hypothetical protein